MPGRFKYAMPMPFRLAIAALALAWISSSRALAAPALVWAPLFDQTAQRAALAGGDTFRHPDFRPGMSLEAIRETIRVALQAAYAKGVRVLDVQYFLSADSLQSDYAKDYGTAKGAPPRSDPSLIAFARSGEDWVQALDELNGFHPSSPMRLRLRLTAYASTLYYVYRTEKPYRTFLKREDAGHGLTRSRFADLPFDPCFENQDPSDACFANSPLPAKYYRAFGADGRLITSVPNLGNAVIRDHIGRWAAAIIDQVRAETGRFTRIEQVSLALDAGGESSLFGDDAGGVVEFGDLKYRPDAPWSERQGFFAARETLLRETYAQFARQVHSRSNRDGTPIRAGIFQQAHQMDGRSRGTFDLYALLKGTGVDVLHHTQPPADYAISSAWTAFSATVADRLGIDFDTEFSWAHFGGPDFLVWRAEKLYPRNALCFRAQARAGSDYGAKAIIFSNWTAHEWTHPPAQPEWRPLLGGPGPAWNDAHLAAGGLLAEHRFPAPAKRAIWISTLGRMACEEAAHAAKAAAPPCDASTYLSWFRAFGLSPAGDGAGEKADVLTDGMVRDDPAKLGDYAAIYFPYETSLRASQAMIEAWEHAPARARNAVHFQTSSGKEAGADYAEWKSRVRGD
jgi:hypothetical protein